MPYKRGKLKGQLTSAELRRVIRKHNELSKINVPTGTDREGLIKIINDNGYNIDHENEKIVPKNKTKEQSDIKVPPPKPRKKKSETDKKFDKELKDLLKTADINIEKDKKKKEENIRKLNLSRQKLKEMVDKKPKKEFKLKSPRKVGEVAKPTKKIPNFDKPIKFKTEGLLKQVRAEAKRFIQGTANKDNAEQRKLYAGFLRRLKGGLGALNLNEKDKQELIDNAVKYVKTNRNV